MLSEKPVAEAGGAPSNSSSGYPSVAVTKTEPDQTPAENKEAEKESTASVSASQENPSEKPLGEASSEGGGGGGSGSGGKVPLRVKRLDKIRWSVRMEAPIEVVVGQPKNEKKHKDGPLPLRAKFEKSWQDFLTKTKTLGDKGKERSEEKEERRKDLTATGLLAAAKKTFLYSSPSLRTPSLLADFCNWLLEDPGGRKNRSYGPTHLYRRTGLKNKRRAESHPHHRCLTRTHPIPRMARPLASDLKMRKPGDSLHQRNLRRRKATFART